jgi:transcription antitermination factor NusG
MLWLGLTMPADSSNSLRISFPHEPEIQSDESESIMTTKFKIGDAVRVLNPHPLARYTGRIEDIDEELGGYQVHLQQTGLICCVPELHLELLEKAAGQTA